MSTPRSVASVRRFLAIPLPDALRATLLAVAPVAASGVRPVDPEGLHLTLHFLGDVEPGLVSAALADLRLDPFELELRGVGQFTPATGDTVLWAGVAAHAALTRLHEDLGQRLRGAGLRTESRPYAPHLTLARCAPRVSKALIEEWLHAQHDLGPLSWPVSTLHLYRSERIVGQAPRYLIEATWLQIGHEKAISY